MEIDVNTAASRLREGALLLDVREPQEVATCQVDGSRHIPMQQISEHLSTLPRDQPILVLCHHGGRSMLVTRLLRANGFTQAINVCGGIDAWARSIDPSLPRY